MPEPLSEYLKAFSSLNVNRSGGHVSPHKPAMLLALLGLAEAGDLKKNKIFFEPALLERYAKYFEVVRGEGDHPNPYFPFFHLQSDGFWHLQSLPGRESLLHAMTTARTMSAIKDNVAFAYLDSDLFDLLSNSDARTALRVQLISKWFSDCRGPLESVTEEERGIDRYEKVLRERSDDKALLVTERPPEPIRCAAFRRVVNENYDYRCAATGWRIILPDSRAMVEAAHLIPFAETFDDDPCNGVALSPSFHWALDAHVIAPGPDYVWHVSDALDERIADNRPLLELRGQKLILPKKRTYWPKVEALEWRLSHMLSK